MSELTHWDPVLETPTEGWEADATILRHPNFYEASITYKGNQIYGFGKTPQDALNNLHIEIRFYLSTTGI
jgi:hypothetical protein